jgi:hypothetical protein
MGFFLWGTFVTCEENWAGYFRRPGDNAVPRSRIETSLRRYGVTSAIGNFAWSTATPTDDVFQRWDARPIAGAPADGTGDYRNEPFQFGWCVEIDPYDPNSRPRKRTALGRMGHEGAWHGQWVAGRKVSVYLGDDARNEYFYKFISANAWDPSDAQRSDRLAVGDKYLDNGILYVARFNQDGTGEWLPLVFGQVPNRPAVGSDPAYVLENQADILINPRLAADAVGATRMDRPEWTATDNRTGEIYLTLTNNRAQERPLAATDAANPRHYNDPRLAGSNALGNPNGHIIRLREGGDNSESLTFTWDIYLFGADSADADAANVNLSSLDASTISPAPTACGFRGRRIRPGRAIANCCGSRRTTEPSPTAPTTRCWRRSPATPATAAPARSSIASRPATPASRRRSSALPPRRRRCGDSRWGRSSARLPASTHARTGARSSTTFSTPAKAAPSPIRPAAGPQARAAARAAPAVGTVVVTTNDGRRDRALQPSLPSARREG